MHETVKHAGRERTRWIPDGATKIKEKSGLGVCYVYTKAENRIVVIGYAGNAAKPTFHFRYRNQGEAAKKVAEFFAGLQSWKRRVEDRRKESNSGHSLKVGDIITNSWGYDQTNVDWYRIVKASHTFVWLEEIAGKMTEDGGFGPMSGHEVPAVSTDGDDPTAWGLKGNGKITKHKASGHNVSMKFGSGSKWDGSAMYSSWYA